MMMTKHGADDSVASLDRFEGDLAVIARLLRQRGFRLSRGKWEGPEGARLPTVCIDRPDTPAWNGVWSVWDDEQGEVQTAFVLAGVAMDTWHSDAFIYEGDNSSNVKRSEPDQ